MSDGGKRKLKVLYGTWTTEDKAVGYCLKHGACVTAQQMKEKECLRKQCGAFRRRKHPFWEQRARMRELKKKKREAGIPPWERVKTGGEEIPPVAEKK